MTDTVTSTAVSHTQGLEGLGISGAASSFRISIDDQGKALITLSDSSVSVQELKAHVALLLASTSKFVFDVSGAASVDKLLLAYIVSLSKQRCVELVTTPQQHQNLVSMRFDKVVGPQFIMTAVESVEPSSRVSAPANNKAWSSSLSTPARKRSWAEEETKPVGPLPPPSTKSGATQVLNLEGYTEIIPPADILLNEESILSLGTYMISLAKTEAYKLNLSGASGAKGPVLAGVLLKICKERQGHDAPPIEVALPQSIKETVTRICKSAVGLTFV